MRLAHIVLNWVIILVFFGLWALVASMLASYENIPEYSKKSRELFVSWNVGMGIVMIAVAFHSIHFLRPDKMIVATYLKDIYAVYATNTIGIVFVGLPFLARAYVLPLTAFTLPFAPMGVNTQKRDDQKKRQRDGTTVTIKGEAVTPLLAYVTITIRLAPNLDGMKALLTSLPEILSRGIDLTRPAKMSFYERMKEDGTVQTKDQDCPTIAVPMSQDLESPLNEKLSQVVAKFSLSEALQTKGKIEDKVREKLSGTLFGHAGFVDPSTGPKMLGLACTLFDINLVELVPSDKDTAKAVSATAKAQLLAKAKIAEAEGDAGARQKMAEADAKYLEKVAAMATTDEGKLALASETLKKLPAGTQLIATPNVVDAVVTQILSKKGTT